VKHAKALRNWLRRYLGKQMRFRLIGRKKQSTSRHAIPGVKFVARTTMVYKVLPSVNNLEHQLSPLIGEHYSEPVQTTKPAFFRL
jgi:hypothetical protein